MPKWRLTPEEQRAQRNEVLAYLQQTSKATKPSLQWGERRSLSLKEFKRIAPDIQPDDYPAALARKIASRLGWGDEHAETVEKAIRAPLKKLRADRKWPPLKRGRKTR